MQMPNAGQAIVDEIKLVEYLLNPAHPDNGGKAAFFMGLGFSVARWQDMAQAFRDIALNTPVAQSVQSVPSARCPDDLDR